MIKVDDRGTALMAVNILSIKAVDFNNIEDPAFILTLD